MAQRALSVRVRQNRFPEILSKLPGLAFQAAEQSARAIQTRAKSLAPVDTGALRNSISVAQDAAPVHSVAWVVYSPLDYSVFQEYGFHHWISGNFIPPQPYMTPAAQQEWPGYQQRTIQALHKL